MSKLQSAVVPYSADMHHPEISIHKLMTLIGVRQTSGGVDPASLPFSLADTTAGSESELQTVVMGKRADVDLPLTIEQSNYYENSLRRTQTGDTPKKKINRLDNYLQNNPEGVWENSWVRFPARVLSSSTHKVFKGDLMADKDRPSAGFRSDRDRFFINVRGEDFIRVPISYLLKLSLSEALASMKLDPSGVYRTGVKLMQNFLNDNTSPETCSLYIVAGQDEGGTGRGIAQEMAIRYLLTQLLIQYANEKFELKKHGQEALVFLSPHPPVRQKELSLCISDAFYRELFMNPCLSGWSRGEEKYQYMHLCHRVLSRSQLNAALKLRDAGIITSNLVTLPNLSNISLANNGTHVSLGSIRISAMLGDPASGFTRYDEKYLGDLAVKIVEHFLPLFVGTYTAAPYRLAFRDFHPENALSFLPHELDFTHLRMLWRRWQKKADLSFLGKSLTPFGPPLMDEFISRLFRLRGDFIPDYRLIDYLVAILSTDKSPALNGVFGNSHQLKRDLSDLGVFDTKMSLYLFEKLREYDVMGFSGFEARHYSLFDSFTDDMARAVDLQNLLYLLAFKYMATGQITHRSIPDEPFVESERRQVVFGSAIGIPTFFVSKKTPNRMLTKIMERTDKTRSSRRYSGYTRVYNSEYRLALLKTLRADAADLIEMMAMKETLDDLECRLIDPKNHAVSEKLTRAILNRTKTDSAIRCEAGTFNLQAESYYRTGLRSRHMEEAFSLFQKAIEDITLGKENLDYDIKSSLRTLLSGRDATVYLRSVRQDIISGRGTLDILESMIGLVIIYAHEKNMAARSNKQAVRMEVA